MGPALSKKEKEIFLLAASVWKFKEVLLTKKKGESTLFNR